jgi:hypothetical protein
MEVRDEMRAPGYSRSSIEGGLLFCCGLGGQTPDGVLRAQRPRAVQKDERLELAAGREVG